MDAPAKKRRSGIPRGNAGEYFVMGELLRRGNDAQLADRNTKGYDLLVGRSSDVRKNLIPSPCLRPNFGEKIPEQVRWPGLILTSFQTQW